MADAVTPLAFDEAWEFDGETLTFVPAHHIAGSSQAAVTTRDGRRIVYTGDIKHPPAPAISSDILIIEGTYGQPRHTRRFKDFVINDFLNLLRETLKMGSVHIFGYHGKLQEVAQLINKNGISVPILASKKIHDLLLVCAKHGMSVGSVIQSGSEEGKLLERTERHIRLYHMGAGKYVKPGTVRIILSGWQFDTSCKKLDGLTYQVALSDHSDFEQLLAYIDISRPAEVIIDGYRARDGHLFAAEITNRLGIPARSLPEKRVEPRPGEQGLLFDSWPGSGRS
jgi:putative mRNA 3-end processing factor